MNKIFLALAGRLAAAQRWLLEQIQKIPGYPFVEDLAEVLTRPVRGLADRVLRLFPSLRRLEWLLEIEPVKDWSTSRDGGPRQIVREDLRL